MALAQPYVTPASLYDTTLDMVDASPGGSPRWPPSRCSTPGSKLPVPHNPPLAEDWENYKSTIVHLYDTLNLSLPAVKKRMEEEYGFIASERMYKGRFSKEKWNIQKNWTDQDILEYLENEGQATIHGKPVLKSRLDRHMKSKTFQAKVKKVVVPPSKATKKAPRRRTQSIISVDSNISSHAWEDATVSLTPLPEPVVEQSPALSMPVPLVPSSRKNSFTSIPPSINTSAMSIYNGNKAFFMLSSYLETRLFSVDHLEHFFGPIDMFPPDDVRSSTALNQALNQHPSMLNQNYARAMALLRNNRPKLASALLAEASGALEHLVVVHHPAFPSCFLDAFVELKFESQQGMSSYVSGLAVRTALSALGPEHPITVLCRFVQSTAKDDVSMEQLLFFCSRFCQLFSKRLGKDHKISTYVNLKYFEKLLQLRRLDQAYTQFVDNVEPAFGEFISCGAVPKTMRAATLCYLRRKAHLLSSVGDQRGAERALRQCVNFAVEWLGERQISVAGNPLMEECFRLIDEIAEFLFKNGHRTKGIDLHSFAIGICAAVRGECEGKCIRMFSEQLVRYADAGFDDRVRILCVRFPSCWVIVDDHDNQNGSDAGGSSSSSSSTAAKERDAASQQDNDIDVNAARTPDEDVPRPTDHILRCQTCANGPDTQLWCEQHRMQEHAKPQDKMYVRLVRESLQDLLAWFGMTGD